MKCLSIQLQPQATTAGGNASFTSDDLIRLVKSVGRYPEVDRDDAHPERISLNLFTEELPVLWQDIQNGVLGDSAMGNWVKQSTIIVCEGEAEDSLLLLSHFDSNEALDNL
jgi:hypothetical protein